MVDVGAADRPAPPGRTRLGLATASVLPLALFAGLLVLVEVRWPPLAGLDRHLADGLHRFALRHDTFVSAMEVVSTLGTSPVYLLVLAVVLVWLLRRRQSRQAVFVVVTVVGGSLLNTIVKTAVGRPRPVFVHPVAHAAYSSFPSGHAQGVTVACGVLLVVLPPWIPIPARQCTAVAAVVWALVMGFSRLALGVHYLSDVAAGYALGACWVLLLRAACGPQLSVSRERAGSDRGRVPDLPA